MIDPREIEGSPERAADRGREEDLGFRVSDRPSLGDAAVVEGLVREFAAAVVSVRRQYNEDKLGGDEAAAAVRDLAREYGRISMGADDRYEPTPWNNQDRLGRRIGLVVPAIDGVPDPGELLFLTIGSSLIDLAVAHESGRLTDDDAKSQSQEMLADTINLLLGLR